MFGPGEGGGVGLIHPVYGRKSQFPVGYELSRISLGQRHCVISEEQHGTAV